MLQAVSLLMDKVINNKRGLEIVQNRSSKHKTSLENFLYQLNIIWPRLVIKHRAAFELLPKLHLQNYVSQLFYFHLSL